MARTRENNVKRDRKGPENQAKNCSQIKVRLINFIVFLDALLESTRRNGKKSRMNFRAQDLTVAHFQDKRIPIVSI